MLTFQDLIKKGVAPANYNTVTNQSVYDGDRIILNYNNIWGCISDTHMGKTDDGIYVITGQIFRDKLKTEQFIYASTWGNYHFRDCSGGWTCLSDFARKNYLTIAHEIVNGDNVLVLHPFTDEQKEYYEKQLSDSSIEAAEQDKKGSDVASSMVFKY